jgi:nucleotide-binding universal stress UspA family protein
VNVAVATNLDSAGDTGTAPVSLARVLVALDQSDYANQALGQAVRLAGSAGGTITGIHAYAAKLHDRRFKQMEGGLPERYQRESEMEHQRDVHEDLIGMGLGLISDSYHDAAAVVCEENEVPFKRLSPEGKNYSCIMDAVNTGEFDVLAMGALGLGAVAGSMIGSVCERVVRRSPIDVLVTRDRRRPIGDGPIVVGMDGSAKSFGALLTALDIGRRLGVPVHVVAAYDPYYHYVAFNKIAGVLDEEAGKVFRFKEQEQLHEELIDDGIAKIYQAHLNVARTVAEDAGAVIVTELVAGKPYQAIRKYIEKHNASLLVIGKTGVHADDHLDIGGNAENLLRMAPCHVWIGQATHLPPADVVAEETIMWSDEAEHRPHRRDPPGPERRAHLHYLALCRCGNESDDAGSRTQRDQPGATDLRAAGMVAAGARTGRRHRRSVGAREHRPSRREISPARCRRDGSARACPAFHRRC